MRGDANCDADLLCERQRPWRAAGAEWRGGEGGRSACDESVVFEKLECSPVGVDPEERDHEERDRNELIVVRVRLDRVEQRDTRCGHKLRENQRVHAELRHIRHTG